MGEQVPNNPGLGTEIPLDFLERIPEQDVAPLLVAPNENNDNFLGLFHRVDVDSLNNWATVNPFMRGI